MNLLDIIRPAQPVPPGLDPKTMTDTRPDWKQTFSGKAILVATPTAEAVSVLDMAVALGGINRYDSHVFLQWPVALHSILAEVMYLQDVVFAKNFMYHLDDDQFDDRDAEHLRLNELFLSGPISRVDLLLHDGHEYVIGDQTSPAACAFEMLLPGFRGMLKNLKAEWDLAIYEHLKLPVVDADRANIVRRYDFRALYVERDINMAPPPAPWIYEIDHAGMLDEYPMAYEFFALATKLTALEASLAWVERLDQALQAVRDDELTTVDTSEALRLVADAYLRLREVQQALDDAP